MVLLRCYISYSAFPYCVSYHEISFWLRVTRKDHQEGEIRAEKRRVSFSKNHPWRGHRSFREPDANNCRHLRLVLDKFRVVKTDYISSQGGREVAGPRRGEIYLYPKQQSPLRGELWETRTAEEGKKEGRKEEEKGRVWCERLTQPQNASCTFPPLPVKIILPVSCPEFKNTMWWFYL